MAVFEFTLSGSIEVDADALGVAVANSVRTQPGGRGEIDVEFGFKFREDPAYALDVLLRQGVFHVMNEKVPGGWTAHSLEATVDRLAP